MEIMEESMPTDEAIENYFIVSDHIEDSSNTELDEHHDTNSLDHQDTIHLVHQDPLTLENQDNIHLEHQDSSLLEAQNANLLETQGDNLLASQESSLLEHHDTNLLEPEDSNLLESQDSNLLEHQDSSILEHQGTNHEPQDSNILKSHENDLLEAHNTDLEQHSSNPLEHQDTSVLESQVTNATENSKPQLHQNGTEMLVDPAPVQSDCGLSENVSINPEPLSGSNDPQKADEPSKETDCNETPRIAVTKVLSASQIDEMFAFNEHGSEVSEHNTLSYDESYDTNPQANIDDMRVVQDELREMDILVCGCCHTVFHFIEDLNSHKPLCKRKSDFHGNITETKPQVWAFLLWKNAVTKNKRGSYVEESSWKLYQKWCKMPDRIRNAWVAAGQTLMNFSTFGSAKPNDSVIKPLPPKRLEKDDFEDGSDAERPVIMRRFVQRDAAGDIKEIKSSTGIHRRLNDDIENIRHQLEDGEGSQDKDMMNSGKEGEEDTLREEEFVVEKIVSRRFNPRRKQYEYLLKWEGYPPEQNTWEPAENLEACQHLLKAFEENLAKQQQKQKLVYNKQKAESVQPSSSTFNNTTSTTTTSGGRPIRYSKQKALSQVKQWCGSIKPDDAELEMLKRKMPLTDSDEEDDPYTKRLRLDRANDSDDSSAASRVYLAKSGKTGIIRRPGRPPLKPKLLNGNTDSLAAVLGLESNIEENKGSAIEAINRGVVKQSTGLSPHNQQVLVANAKGVVKVDPSQVPNLSSGVYIMSNKSGIMKLDSVSPSKALSLKGVQQQQPPTVKQLPPPSGPPPVSQTVTSTTQSGVIMVNRDNQGTTKSGLMRRPGVPPTRGRGVGRPPSRLNNIRATNPNTRLIHSGSRSNVNLTPGIRPRAPGILPKSAVTTEVQQRRPERLFGPRRGGIQRGGMRGGRGGTGSKVLLKAEGEKTPQPSPPHSPKQNNIMEVSTADMLQIKQEPITSIVQTPTSNFISKINSAPSTSKETLVKKTLKPGSIGSMSVSPKKTLDDEDEMVTITGDDGSVYKMRKSELNNSLMLGDDGQQCVLLTSGDDGEENTTVLTLDSSYSDVSQLGQVNILGGDGENETQFFLKGGEEGEMVSLQVQDQDGMTDDSQSQVVAQLVDAGEPTPGGGPRRVVLLLPDGNLMMTEVDEEQYAALELDKYQSVTDVE